ncbi:amino acid transporter [Lithospermum erythrorhizon]|uniref:Amino acid transporter n=1 Tax=Lithospermum erythrorhizon TaxID=34254 RepID=A0AAV3Q9Y4_LITER
MAPQTEDGGGPLLPEVHHQERVVYDDRRSGGGSISGAIFNVSTGMVGAGIMSIPATFKVLGIVPSFVVILVIAFFVEVTVDFLLKYTHFGESHTYAGLMNESFGKFGSVGLQLSNLGALIIYLIIIGKFF